MKTLQISLCAAGVLLSALSARANVYATDIKVNGSLTAVTTNAMKGSPVSITYRLNQAATAGVIINVLHGTNVVASIPGGTNMGLNTVSWTSPVAGTDSFSITAAAAGFTNWTQISVDTNAGMPAYYPRGLDVDKNTDSPYYGRVIMSSAYSAGRATSVPAAAQKDGLFKMNADGSQADEGWYGNANYLADDGGDALVAGQMPNSQGYNPLLVRIGDDDRIYWCDDSALGAIVACDILATTNQIVIKEAGYENNPDGGDPSENFYGIQQFDVTGAATDQAAVWLVGTDTEPNWGVWLYQLKNGVADPADTEGTQAVTTNANLIKVTGAGCMVDDNFDIFVSQNVTDSGDSAKRTVLFSNWNGGGLPPEAGGTSYAVGTDAGQAAWAVGGGDNTMTGINDTVINSRTSPTLVALPMGPGAPVSGGYQGQNGGIRVLNAADGSVVSVTNGAAVQTLTNVDFANWYTCAAWDNAGNLYGASTSANLWRVWSPPGANTNTTAALAQVVVSTWIKITSVTASRTSPGCATVTLAFTANENVAPSAFQLTGSSTLKGVFTPVGATITGSAGSYQAVFTNCSAGFYLIEQPAS